MLEQIGGKWYLVRLAPDEAVCQCGQQALVSYEERNFNYSGPVLYACRRCEEALVSFLAMCA